MTKLSSRRCFPLKAHSPLPPPPPLSDINGLQIVKRAWSSRPRHFAVLAIECRVTFLIELLKCAKCKCLHQPPLSLFKFQKTSMHGSAEVHFRTALLFNASLEWLHITKLAFLFSQLIYVRLQVSQSYLSLWNCLSGEGLFRLTPCHYF